MSRVRNWILRVFVPMLAIITSFAVMTDGFCAPLPVTETPGKSAHIVSSYRLNHRKDDRPDTQNEGIPCPSGPVHIAEIRAVIGHGMDSLGADILGAASVEICSTDPTGFSDIVTRGTPPEGGPNTENGSKVGVGGVVQVNGRTARMDVRVYAPLSARDEEMQCAGQEENGTAPGNCVPHAFVASFAGTWVFMPGRWKNLSVGADSAGDPVILMVRISDGTDE